MRLFELSITKGFIEVCEVPSENFPREPDHPRKINLSPRKPKGLYSCINLYNKYEPRNNITLPTIRHCIDG